MIIATFLGCELQKHVADVTSIAGIDICVEVNEKTSNLFEKKTEKNRKALVFALSAKEYAGDK